MKDIEALLARLSCRAGLYDNNLKPIYSNSRSDGSFLPENESKKLPEWIWQGLHQSLEKVLHLQIPAGSFDAILTQTYQLILDTFGQSLGAITYIQGLEPLLSDYLRETGQTIVAWSDTASGPPIGNDLQE